MQPTARRKDRQTALLVSVAVGVVVAVVTTATFWWIYSLTLGETQSAAAVAEAAPYDPSSGLRVITNADPTPTYNDSDGRDPWLGNDAWTKGVQAGQAWVQEYPQTLNVQVLTGMSSAQIWAYMQQHVSGALGVSCQYCHNINNFASDEYPQKARARAMLYLVNDVNSEFIVNLPNWKGNYVQCATCHNNQAVGMPAVSERFTESNPPIDVVVDPLDENGTPILDDASKPEELQGTVDLQDAILYYTYNYKVWDPYDPNDPESGRGSLALTYNGGRTQDQVTINQGAMNQMGWSLGVGCNFCHNSRNFVAYETNPAGNVTNPQYAYNKLKTVRMMLLTTWLADNWDKYGAQPRTEEEVLQLAAGNHAYRQLGDGAYYNVPGCYTCHRGYSVPKAAVNQAEIPEGDPGQVVFPVQLRGTNASQ